MGCFCLSHFHLLTSAHLQFDSSHSTQQQPVNQLLKPYRKLDSRRGSAHRGNLPLDLMNPTHFISPWTESERRLHLYSLFFLFTPKSVLFSSKFRKPASQKYKSQMLKHMVGL